MAKLTARFDVKDNMTKKIRTIRGEVEKLERARARVNKPVTLTMRARDMASNILRRLGKFVAKDIAKTHTLVIQVKDRATKTLTAVSNFMKRRMPRTYSIFVGARDRAMPVLQRIGRFAASNIIGTRMMMITARDRAMPLIRRISAFAATTLSKGYSFSIRAIDLASRTIGRVAAFTRSSIPRVYTSTIRVVDMATRPLRSIAKVATSTLGLLGVAGGVAGGIVMPIKMVADREDLATSFEVMLGSKAASDARMEDLTAFAGRTPLTRDEIFRSSRILQTFTGDALATSKGMELIGDVAVGTQTDLEDTAMWFGRLYDGLESGRPIGAATSRLQEMGAISGAARQRIEDLAESGQDISKTWPKVTKEFDKYNGMMEKMSHNMHNLLLGLKSFVGNSILMPWGEGLRDVFKPALLAFRKWRGEYSFVLADMSRRLKMTGSGFAEGLLKPLNPAFKFIGEQMKMLFPGESATEIRARLNDKEFKEWQEGMKVKFEEDPAFAKRWIELAKYRNMTFETRWKLAVDTTKDAIGEWWETTGKANAVRIGEGIGSTYGGFIRSALLTLLGGESEKTGNPFIDAGVTSGKSFITGFLEALDPVDLSKRIGSKLAEINLNAGKSIWGKMTGNEEMANEGSIGGALVANAFALAFGSVIISKLKPAANLIKSLVWDFPKKAIGLFGGKGPQTPKQPKQPKSNYRMPWTNRGEKPNLNTPNQKGGFKMPKGLSKGLGGLGKFVKRVPVIGTALSALSILTASKEEKAGAIGAVGGGIGGAALGAAVGSVIPGIGTAIGGIIGGIAGAMGGGALGDWLSDNWSSIKEGATSTGRWIADKFNEAVTWTKETWSGVIGWFSDTFWSPFVDGFQISLDFVVGLYDIAEEGIKMMWGELSSWFDQTIWTPLKTMAGIAWGFITEQFTNAWTAIQLIWGIAWAWFDETVWTPLSTSAGIAWGFVTGYVTNAWGNVVAVWGIATGWFDETVWSPITTAAETLGTWIGDKFTEGWNAVVTIWDSASSYFEENIWGPIKTGAAAVEEAIKTPFKNAWEYVSGIFTKLGDTWDTLKDWGGKAASYVVERGKNRREGTPTYARGTNYHPGGPAIVGDGGGPELIRYPSGNMSLSPGTDTMMNLPRGTEVLSHKKTIDFFNAVPAYADGVGFGGGTTEKAILPKEQVAAVTSTKSGGRKSAGGAVRDVVVQITGDNHYSDDMDAEKVGKTAYEYIKKKLDEELFEGGAAIIYD